MTLALGHQRKRRKPAVQDTSREAWRTSEDARRTINKRILAFLEFMKNEGATDREMEDALHIRQSALSGCRRHLVERGLVRASNKRRPTPSGRAAIVWLHVPQTGELQRSLFQDAG
jgi:hypothetical protein